MNDFEFENDPIFSSLKTFAAAPVDVEMSLQIKEAFVNGRKQLRIRKYGFRGLLGVLTISIALPALAAANVLPAPVKHFVENVQHVATTSVKHLVNPAAAFKDAIKGKDESKKGDESGSADDQPISVPAVTEDQEDEVINGSSPTEKSEDSKNKEDKSKDSNSKGLALGKDKKSGALLATLPTSDSNEEDGISNSSDNSSGSKDNKFNKEKESSSNKSDSKDKSESKNKEK